MAAPNGASIQLVNLLSYWVHHSWLQHLQAPRSILPSYGRIFFNVCTTRFNTCTTPSSTVRVLSYIVLLIRTYVEVL